VGTPLDRFVYQSREESAVVSPASPPLRSRRGFLASSLAGAAVLGTRALRAAEEPPPSAGSTEKVIDCHAHLQHHSNPTWEADDRKLIDAADRLKIDQLCCSVLTPKRPATVEGFQHCNRWVLEAMGRYPSRVLGYCYVNPGFTKEAVDEVRRCIEKHGFIGVKLYNEFRCTDPIVFPVIETAINLGVPILHHAGHLHYPLAEQPKISDGGHLAALARRYPEAKLICAHICGGGDWEWTIKALRDAPTVYLDTSGSVADEGVIEMAVRTLGVGRLVFGCDMSMTAGMGRIRAAALSPSEKQQILGGTMRGLLKGRKA
jgi:predicted TIM-barrel fold metal-dependent hydrolase